MSTSPDPVDLLGVEPPGQLTLDAKFRFCPLPLFSIKIDIEYSLLPEPGTLLKVKCVSATCDSNSKVVTRTTINSYTSTLITHIII